MLDGNAIDGPVKPDPSWPIGKHALMNLNIVKRKGRTEIDPSNWRIPYQWQGTHYQDNDDQPFLLLINAGGGFVEGDVAELHARMEPGTRAVITTTAASKFYKCPGKAISRELVRLHVGPEALLEYYPDESIPFAQSRVERRTEIDIASSSRLFAVDMLSAGRIHYGAGEIFAFDQLQSEFSVRIDGQTRFVDRIVALDRDEARALKTLWQGAHHVATVVCYDAALPHGIEAEVEAALADHGLTSAGASRVGNMLTSRILAKEAWHCHEAVQRAWGVVRPHIAGKPAKLIRKC
ncbi:urease accessory protein UreD [Hyphomicrobium sp.]|uniref:urease accessory protein UreD n=1 Tax=Hyphomicrobium sp. TaxID=82 RepID=UPI003F72011A